MSTNRIDYNDRFFRSSARETADTSGEGPVGHYHQEGEFVWAEFSGGSVVRGFLSGSMDHEGILHFAYCQLLTSGPVAGLCTTTPEVLSDGRLRLHEHWQRFDGSTGVSVIEEFHRDKAEDSSP